MPKTPVFTRSSFVAHIAHDGCLLPTLGLYRHGKPVGMNDFTRLSQRAPATARKTLLVMKRYGLVAVRRHKRGAAIITRVTLTDLGRRVGEILDQIDAVLPGAFE